MRRLVTTRNILIFCLIWAVLKAGLSEAALLVLVPLAFLWLLLKGRGKGLVKFIKTLLAGLGRFLAFLIFGQSRNRGARFMDGFEAAWFFGGKGWLIDGKARRLSEKVSYKSIMTIAGVGVGKTANFVFPNIFTMNHCSLVITDTSGELYEQSSGYLKRNGFDILCLNLMDMRRSHGYNPLANASSFSEVSKLAHLIVRSGAAGGERDQYWNNGAETIIRVLIQCLKNRGDQDVCTLGRLKQLLSGFDHFTAKDSQFDRFVMESTLTDTATWESYKGFLTGPEKTVLSFLSTATTALMALGNPELARLTSIHQIDFNALRRRKTALFILVRQQDMSNYQFILNAFYADLFQSLMHELNSAALPVYALLDEFGNIHIPDFQVIASTARKYKLAFWLFLQSQSQLDKQYGQHGAKTIVDALGSEIYLAGSGLETAERLSRRMGKKRPHIFAPKVNYQDGNLMNADEIIAMRDSEALFLHSNKRPFKYRVKPYYRHRRFSRLAKIRPVILPTL